MTWQQAMRGYLERLRVRGLAATTRAKCGRDLEAFVRFCQTLEAEGPRDLTTRHLAAYRRHLMWTPTCRGRLATPSTVAGRLGAARSWVRWLVAEGHLLVDPTRNLVIPKPPQALPRLLTPAQVAWILEAPDPRRPGGLRDRALLETLYYTGIRREECRRLDLCDYDLPQATLRVRRPKNRQERLVPVGPALAAALERYLNQGRPRLVRLGPAETALFVSNRGRRISTGRIDQVVHDTARSLGLEGVGPHSLRHACATHLLAGGADIRHVQALLGHLHLDGPQRYTHLQPLEVFADHVRTHPRARRKPPGPKPPGLT